MIYYHTNNIYSIAALTNSTGDVVERYTYEPFGTAKVLAADGLTVRASSGFGNAFGYTGRRLDTETGLIYYRARYFSKNQGRFISRDPIDAIENFVGVGVDSWLECFINNSPMSMSKTDNYSSTLVANSFFVRRGLTPNLFEATFVPNATDPTGLQDCYWQEYEISWQEERNKGPEYIIDIVHKTEAVSVSKTMSNGEVVDYGVNVPVPAIHLDYYGQTSNTTTAGTTNTSYRQYKITKWAQRYDIFKVETFWDLEVCCYCIIAAGGTRTDCQPTGKKKFLSKTETKIGNGIKITRVEKEME